MSRSNQDAKRASRPSTGSAHNDMDEDLPDLQARPNEDLEEDEVAAVEVAEVIRDVEVAALPPVVPPAWGRRAVGYVPPRWEHSESWIRQSAHLLQNIRRVNVAGKKIIG